MSPFEINPSTVHVYYFDFNCQILNLLIIQSLRYFQLDITTHVENMIVYILKKNRTIVYRYKMKVYPNTSQNKSISADKSTVQIQMISTPAFDGADIEKIVISPSMLVAVLQFQRN